MLIRPTVKDLLNMRMAPFIIQARERIDKMRYVWSRGDYHAVLVELEAQEAAFNNFAAEIKTALEAMKGNPDESPNDF